MKKIGLLLLILFSFILALPCYALENIDYTESIETFNNPERGFYKPLRYDFKVEGNKVPNNRNLSGNLMHLRLGIGAFSGKVNNDKDLELSEDMLNTLDQMLKTIKANGGTAIVRFAYDNFAGTKDLEPSLDMIYTHIEQICEVLKNNSEVVAYLEHGFFGPWGEMHSSKVSSTENVSKSLDMMLDMLPESITIGVRTPNYYAKWLDIKRAELDKNISTKGMKSYRVGLFNDGYLGSSSDLGTFSNRAIEVAWLENQARHTFYGGEVVGNYQTTGNRINTSYYMAEEAFKTHTTYINSEYNVNVINSWKDEIYNGSDPVYQNQTGYLYIANHLGYRFVLKKSVIDDTYLNSKLNINLAINNVGFANLIKNKKVTFVLSNGSKTYEILTNVDPTIWNSNETSNVSISVDLPKELTVGKWEVYLRISQYGDYQNDNNYLTVRLANNNIWNEELGANYIGDVEITNKPIIEEKEPEGSKEDNVITDSNDSVNNNETYVDNELEDNSNIVEEVVKVPATDLNSYGILFGLIFIIIGTILFNKYKKVE